KEGVTLRVQGTTVIDTVNLNAGARVEEDGVEGDGVKDVNVDPGLPEGTTIVLRGNFNSVQVNAGSITIELEDGHIIELGTGDDAKNLNIVLDPGSSVGTLTLNAPAKVSGTGAIDKAVINAAGCTLEQKPNHVTLAPDVTAVVDGKTVGLPTGGGGGGTVTPPTPVVSGSIAWDPAKTGGEDLTVTINGNTITFEGAIDWYPADESLGRAAGNRVGVEIIAPEDFDAKDAKVTIGGKEYTFGEERFFWYPLVTEAGQEFTATVKWSSASTQVFTVKISENSTLKTPKRSVYAYQQKSPVSTAIVSREYTVGVRYYAVAVNELGIDAARFRVEVTGPDDQPYDPDDPSISLLATDSNGVEHDIAAIGWWGPEGGFPISPDYDATTWVKLVIRDPGKYKITIRLADVSGGQIEYIDRLDWTIDAFLGVTRVDGEVTQDPGRTGGELSYSFTASTNTLIIDAGRKYLPYYPQSGQYPPKGANWVGVAIPVPEGVATGGVTATVNGSDCGDLHFALGKYIEYISVDEDDLTGGSASFEWVIDWGAGYASEKINIVIVNVGGLQKPVVRDANSVTQDPGFTGGTGLHYGFDAETNTLTICGGPVKYYEEADGFPPPTSGNWVGVAIKAPAGFSGDIKALTIDDTPCTASPILSELEQQRGELWYYFKATEQDAVHTLVIEWSDAYTAETITIQTSGLSLEPAPA
ncbi:MAG TPA: hypothetical protein GXX23_01190, partial [Firmicutes bacterium]|nr:hypothetical protein [Candidatus Fermentithermobacillaceae bacterium]